MPRRWLLTLAALSALATLSTNLLLPSPPAIAQAPGSIEAAVTAVLGRLLAAFAAAQWVVGPLADRIGRRPVVQVGLAVFVGGRRVGAVAADLPCLLAGTIADTP